MCLNDQEFQVLVGMIPKLKAKMEYYKETKQDEKFNNLTSLYRAILNFSLLHLEETI